MQLVRRNHTSIFLTSEISLQYFPTLNNKIVEIVGNLRFDLSLNHFVQPNETFLYSKFDAGVGKGRPTRVPIPPAPVVVILPFCVRFADDLRDSVVPCSLSLFCDNSILKSCSLGSVRVPLEI